MPLLAKLVAARAYLLSLFETALTAACYIAAAFICLSYDAVLYLEYEGGWMAITLVAVTFFIGSYLFDFYKQTPVRSRLVLALQVCQLIGIIFFVEAAFVFISRDLVLPQLVLLVGGFLTLAVLLAWRLFLRPHVWNAFGTQTILFVGIDEAVERLVEAFQKNASLGCSVIGFITASGSPPTAGPILGSDRDLMDVVFRHKPHRIIVSDQNVRNKGLLKALADLRSRGSMMETAGQAYETIFGRIYSRGVEPYTVVFRNDLAARPGSVALQSVYTNLIALAGVIVTFPFILLIAVMMKLIRRGPVFFSYRCVGLHGIPFDAYRFNCSNPDPLSRFLVRYKLDGLPHALNIIRGEMALIGPRAERVEFSSVLDEYLPFYRHKQHVKPGLIGWSQLHCDGQPTEDTLARIEYDLYYIKHISLVLDAYILLLAFKWMLTDQQQSASAA